MSQSQEHSAFPVGFQEESPLYPGYGLSKKELFTAMAMQAILSNQGISQYGTNAKFITNASIEIANELCKQLGILK